MNIENCEVISNNLEDIKDTADTADLEFIHLEEKMENIMNDYLVDIKYFTQTKGLPLLENILATDLIDFTYRILNQS